MLAGADCIADIGCDHGRLSVALLQRGLCKRVIASDVSSDSLQKARLLAKTCEMDNRLSLRLGDGLSILRPGEADALVMAGMGGSSIVRMLEQSEQAARAAKCIVMQPMRGEDALRFYLYHNGYNITDEMLVEDAGRIYQLLCAKSGEPEPKPGKWPEKLYKLGWIMYKKNDPLLLTQINKSLAGYKRRLKSAPAALFLREQTKCLEDLLILIGGNEKI